MNSPLFESRDSLHPKGHLDNVSFVEIAQLYRRKSVKFGSSVLKHTGKLYQNPPTCDYEQDA